MGVGLRSSEIYADKVCLSGHAGDYQVQRAVGQCPRSCMHYVTPSQRIILEELLDRYILPVWLYLNYSSCEK